MRFFVTGATGFIGLHLCRRLVAEGHQVHALVRNPTKGRALPPEVSVVEGDLGLFQEEELQLPPVDVVVHLAGVVAGESEQQYWDVNYAAVRDMVACLERQSFRVRRVLFASSLAAGGPSRDRPRRETDPDDPVEPYGRAKREAEIALHDSSIPVTSFRPALVLGPGDPAFLTLFRLAKWGLGFRVAGHHQRLSVVSVADVIDAVVLMANDTSSANKTYFVSHPRALTLEELWRALGRALNKRVVVVPVPSLFLRLGVWLSSRLGLKSQLDTKQYAQMTAPAWTCDSTALRSDLSWLPQVDPFEAARETARGYLAAGWL